MRKIRIAIVDSGVRLDHPAVQGHHPVVVRYSGLGEGEGDCGHGTAVYNIVKKQKALLILSIFKSQIRMEKSVRKYFYPAWIRSRKSMMLILSISAWG